MNLILFSIGFQIVWKYHVLNSEDLMLGKFVYNIAKSFYKVY